MTLISWCSVDCFIKARANARNIVGRQDATLLSPTCCKPLHTMLCVVATSWKLLPWMKFETGQTSAPTSANISIVSRSSKRGRTMLGSFAQHIQQSCTGHAHYMPVSHDSNLAGMNQRVVCMELWVFVSQSPLNSHLKTQHVVTCCERLHTSANIAQHEETTMLAQQCCVDLSQGLASGTSPIVCTRVLYQNSSRRDHIFGPCD